MQNQTNMEATTPAGAVPGKPMDRKDVYTIVNERVIEKLENGCVPWRQPWSGCGIPRNIISQKAYRGINLILLSMLGYERNIFLTYRQAKDLGANIKKGEHSHMVVFWNYIKQQPDNEDTAQPKQQPKRKPLLRYYHVFNIEQCENIPPQYQIHRDVCYPIPTCESILTLMPQRPTIFHKADYAFYSPVGDYIGIPPQRSFRSPAAYYSTLFHELVHSTGHVSRLNRPDLMEMAAFGSEVYSKEELVAEIGACYLQSLTAITSEFEQSAGYIQHWISKLRNDKRLIFSAAAHAQKAVDFILNIPFDAAEEAIAFAA